MKALKICIQCAKVLADTKVIKFYPSKFVIITEILDLFGRLVFERLRNRCKETAPDGKPGKSLPGTTQSLLFFFPPPSLSLHVNDDLNLPISRIASLT